MQASRFHIYIRLFPRVFIDLFYLLASAGTEACIVVFSKGSVVHILVWN